MLIPRGRRRGAWLESSTGNNTLLGSAASDACGVSSLLPWRRAAEAGKVDVQGTLTFWGEKHLGSSGLDTRVFVSPGLQPPVERKPLNPALPCY